MNVSKPVFVGAILVSFLSAMMISQVFNAIAFDGGGNPFDGVWEAIEDLQTQIDEIELTPGPQGPIGPQGLQGPPGGFGAPDYDSGWVSFESVSSSLDHGLGTKNLFVYLVGRQFSLLEPAGWRTHQKKIGTDDDGDDLWGVYWSLIDENTIYVQRAFDEWRWEYFRVYIWIIQ